VFLFFLLLLLAGAAPFFMSERAMDKLRSRKTKPQTYNLDMNLIGECAQQLRCILTKMHHLCCISYVRLACMVGVQLGHEPRW
jgi:aspartate aminotransferase-like enzyme